MRTCIEVEANFKAIFKENTYTKPERKWNIVDYKKINISHHLDDYSIELPNWTGVEGIRYPFKEWKIADSLSWYKAYNNSKHDRINNFKDANLQNLLDAYCGLLALLSSQFFYEEFKAGAKYIPSEGYSYFGEGFGIGNYLIVDFPDDWIEDDYYDFDITEFEKGKVEFQKFDYDSL
jgi:hypothetical protein